MRKRRISETTVCTIPISFGSKGTDLNKAKAVLIGIACLSAALTGSVAQEVKDTASPSQGVREIRLTLKKYEFIPNQLHVTRGEHVKLIMSAVDHDHGFKLEDFDINVKVKKGTTAISEFTADKSGTFPFRCSTVCGLGHRGMKGTLVVDQ